MKIEFILGIIMVTMGIISLVYTINAKNKFPKESELYTITGRLIIIIGFLTSFSVWHFIRDSFNEEADQLVEYPEYAFITITFFVILITAKYIYETAKKFGITK